MRPYISVARGTQVKLRAIDAGVDFTVGNGNYLGAVNSFTADKVFGGPEVELFGELDVELIGKIGVTGSIEAGLSTETGKLTVQTLMFKRGLTLGLGVGSPVQGGVSWGRESYIGRMDQILKPMLPLMKPITLIRQFSII